MLGGRGVDSGFCILHRFFCGRGLRLGLSVFSTAGRGAGFDGVFFFCKAAKRKKDQMKAMPCYDGYGD